ncbi:ATP-binding protein [Rhodococcus sp. G-MC3]|uniref:ATP-binding protein n=1 Tax=Rhodococcus sp. G-MC3 TaxID=3046209 RepID=UPI0024BA2068|nr:ATP-binding protein [Rhodococcus sp. G-MC3]MDJ0395254.1 ATP-binding protein [Rhodococcus sp. G-MC3]
MMAIAFGEDDALAASDRRPQAGLPRGDVMNLNFDGESAVADRASALRVALREWLTSLQVAPDRVYDVVLATYEALANAVEHAYVRDSAPGTLDLHARCMPKTGWIEVVVSDRGAWDVHAPDSTRGRGVPLMHALADSTAVTSDHDGTTVRLVWDALTPA